MSDSGPRLTVEQHAELFHLAQTASAPEAEAIYTALEEIDRLRAELAAR